MSQLSFQRGAKFSCHYPCSQPCTLVPSLPEIKLAPASTGIDFDSNSGWHVYLKTLYFVISQHRSKVLCVFSPQVFMSLPCHAILKCDVLLLFISMPLYAFSSTVSLILLFPFSLPIECSHTLQYQDWNCPYTKCYLPAWVNQSLC